MKKFSGSFSDYTESMLLNQTDKFSHQDLWLLRKIYWYEPNIYFNIINLLGFKIGLDETIVEDCFWLVAQPQKNGILYGRNLCPYHKTRPHGMLRSVPEEEWRRYRDKSQFKVTMLSTHPSVKTLGRDSFFGFDSITHIFLGDSVKKVSSGSFSCCQNLKYVELSKYIKIINKRTFICCMRLEKIKMPNVEVINSEAFDNCISLKTLIIPATIKYVDEFTFVSKYWHDKGLHFEGNMHNTYKSPTLTVLFPENFKTSHIRVPKDVKFTTWKKINIPKNKLKL